MVNRIQKLFKLKDGERIVSVMSFDPRVIGNIEENPKKPDLCPEVQWVLRLPATAMRCDLDCGPLRIHRLAVDADTHRCSVGAEIIGVNSRAWNREHARRRVSRLQSYGFAPVKKSITCLELLRESC